MFVWDKLGRIFNPQDVQGLDWMKEYAQAPCSLVFKDFVRVYFSCRPFPDDNAQYKSYTGYVDLDRSNLFNILRVSKEPILPLGKIGSFDEFGTYPACVIRNNQEIIAYYGGWTRCESIPFTVSIGIAKSNNDGVTFQKLGDGPLLTCSLKEPYVLSGPKVRKFGDIWYMWYVAVTEWLPNNGKPEAVYKIRVATSKDGLTWERNGQNIITDVLELNECQASPDVFFYEGKYHMFFCYKYSLDFRNNNRGYRIGYASSEDLVHWTRNDALAGIDVSDNGWDDQSIAYPHIMSLDGKMYLFYIGNQVGKYGFGIAELNKYIS